MTYEWIDGSYFLVQQVDLEQYGQRIEGMEVIGHNREFGAEPDQHIRSCFYDSMGNTLRYVYDADGDTLTIWAGDPGSPAYFRGTYSADDTSLVGAWVYPGGGGYESTMTKVEGG